MRIDIFILCYSLNSSATQSHFQPLHALLIHSRNDIGCWVCCTGSCYIREVVRLRASCFACSKNIRLQGHYRTRHRRTANDIESRQSTSGHSHSNEWGEAFEWLYVVAGARLLRLSSIISLSWLGCSAVKIRNYICCQHIGQISVSGTLYQSCWTTNENMEPESDRQMTRNRTLCVYSILV